MKIIRLVINFFRRLNQIFIAVILFVFYYVVVGLASVIYRLTRKKNQGISYWQDIEPIKQIDSYFESPY